MCCEVSLAKELLSQCITKELGKNSKKMRMEIARLEGRGLAIFLR